MYDSSPEVDSDMHIPDSLLGDINRDMVELYYELLTEVESVDIGFRIKDTQGEIICKIHTDHAALLTVTIISLGLVVQSTIKLIQD